MQNDIVQGIDLLEVASILPNGSVDDTSWTPVENLGPGSVTLTSNQDTTTSIIPEDKTNAIIQLYTPGDPDVFNFGLLEFSKENAQRFFNIEFDDATSSVTILAEKKRANLALRMTSFPQFGVRKVFTYKNTTSVAAFGGEISKTGLLQLSIAASILPWRTVSGKDALWIMQKVTEDGSTINSTAPTVTVPADKSVSSATTTITGTASAAGGKTVSNIQWSQLSGPNNATLTNDNTLTVSVAGMVTGAYTFRMVVTDSQGVQSYDDIVVTATVS